jgi:hypothetical protein
MYRYTDWVTEDFAEHKKHLSQLQRRAEQRHLSDRQRQRRQAAVWDAIRELPSVADMLGITVPTGTADGSAHVPAQTPSWGTYEQAERLALVRITTATLAKRT